MIVNAFLTKALSISSHCSLFIPKREGDDRRSVAIPEMKELGMTKQKLANGERVISQISPKASVVVSHSTGVWKDEEIEIVSQIMKRGVTLVLDGGAVGDQSLVIQKDVIDQLRQLEKLFFRPCSLLLSLKLIPWSVAAPFILKYLLQMKEGTCLFLDSGMTVLPSSLIADIAWGLKQTNLNPSRGVSFIPILRQGTFQHTSGLVEIPFFQELERIQCELQGSSACGGAFLEKEGVQPLCLFPQSWFLRKAIELNMSLRSLVRMTLRQKRNLTLQQMEEREADLMELEKTFLSHKGVIPEDSAFSTILGSFIEKNG